MQRGRSLVVALLCVLVHGACASSQVTFTMNAHNYRLQALSPTLLRLERESPVGFLDNTTWLVQERAWAGDALVVDEQSASVLKAHTETLAIAIAVPPSSK